MAESMSRWKQKGVEHVFFGDLFLENIRAYREKQLSRLGLHGVFPLWGLDTGVLARKMIHDGFKAILSCVDLKKLPLEFAGRRFNEDLFAAFPPGIDPCGENGEFHSFVYGAPIFKEEIPIVVGKTVEREGFAFADLIRRQV
jgi:diphthamide synthase (EF-2-diphthine--ammonia ligase)